MHRSSKKIVLAVPRSIPLRAKTLRHHASEPWKPRPTDLCADRIAALATCVALRGPIVLSDGSRIDADALESLAREQHARESDLDETFGKTRVLYEDYHRATRRVRELLLAGIAAFEGRIEKTDSAARTALRTAKLRRPPKATIARLQAIAKKRRGDTG